MKIHPWRVSLFLLFIGILTGCCQSGSGGNNDDLPNGPIPSVTSTSPTDNTTNVPLNQFITATFNMPMAPSTVTNSSFLLNSGSQSIAADVSYSGLTAILRPQSDLEPNTDYTVTVTNAAENMAGTAIARDYVWTISTGSNSDNAPPTVIAVSPEDGDVNVPLGADPSATFSEAMDPASLTTASFTLMDNSDQVAGSVSYADGKAIFTPQSNLHPGRLYTAMISGGVTDLSGNHLLGNYLWSFRTAGTDPLLNTPPLVTFTAPANNEENVALNIRPLATFSQPMDPDTITGANFQLRLGTTAVAGSVSYSGVSAVFTPNSPLLPNSDYQAIITSSVRNVAGVAMLEDYSWTFRTGTGLDTQAPSVVFTAPEDGDSGVAININPSADFSEAMDPLTIDASSFRLMQGSSTVAGNVFYSGVSAIFLPLGDLAPNTVYTATVSSSASDLAGNEMGSDYVWSFTTGSGEDTTAPTVLSTVPVDGAVNVSTDINIRANMSEALNPLTVNSSTIRLRQGSNTVDRSVYYSGGIIHILPLGDLEANTTYTITITDEIEDLAGNSMLNDYVWSFTTGSQPDTLAPEVISTIPADEASNVDSAVVLEAEFSEAMAPATINDSSFILFNGLIPVSGSVSYSGTTATFTPDAELDTNTLYSATITTDAEDLAGNPLAADYEWSFTTEVVDLGEIDHIGGFGGGAGMTNQGTLTVVDGDIATTAAATLVTGFHDSAGDIYTETPLNVGSVTGIVYAAPPPPGSAQKFVVASQAALDAQQAYIDISPASLPGGSDPGAGELGGLTLPPGVYAAAGGTFQITGSNLVLDAGGDPDAVWVFQAASSLTVGDTAARSVTLINGAQAKNVYWYVGSAATINAAGGGTMVGTIIASAGVTFSTAGNVVLTFLEGRAIGLNASVTLVNTIINIPE